MYTFINTVYTHAVWYDYVTVCVLVSDSICLLNQGLFHVISVSTCEVSVGIQSHLQVHRPVTLPHFEGLKHFPLPTVPSKWLLLDCVVARPWNNVFCWTSLVTDVSNPHRLEEYILLVLFHSTLYEYSCWHTLVPCRKSLHHTLWTLVICMCNVVIIIHTLTLRAERCTLEAILLEKPNKVCSLFHGSFMMK